jgi:hypothetical protein
VCVCAGCVACELAEHTAPSTTPCQLPPASTRRMCSTLQHFVYECYCILLANRCLHHRAAFSISDLYTGASKPVTNCPALCNAQASSSLCVRLERISVPAVSSRAHHCDARRSAAYTQTLTSGCSWHRAPSSAAHDNMRLPSIRGPS